MPTPSVSDTNPETFRVQTAILRSQSIDDKARIIEVLYRDTQRMAETGVRIRYPDADEHEVFLRVTALRIGRELSVAAYGWDPEEEGW